MVNEIYHYRGIEQLHNLEYLNVACNKISQLRDLSGLKNLKTLELSIFELVKYVKVFIHPFFYCLK
jgi:hypothetical protein